MDNQRATLLVMVDLSAGFDTIDHAIIDPLQAEAVIDGTALQWFVLYLVNHTAYHDSWCYINGVSSVNTGVPQGSFLVPVLCTIYAASLFRVI